MLISSIQLFSVEYSFRKYQNVKNFYANITNDVIKIATKYKLPPAAILAIAGLESGYGSGYVAQITGNILSLGAFKGDKELPALYLPYSKSQNKILFAPRKIVKLPKNDLVWKTRAKSYKRDYRPLPYAGTTHYLDLLVYNKTLNHRAKLACLNDFATRWIVKNSNIKVFKEARIWLDEVIKQKGVDALFDAEINSKFINKIGGLPKSFNYRKTWPIKVKKVMQKTGLVKLTKDIYFKKESFNNAWRKHG